MRLVAQLALREHFSIMHVQFRKAFQIVASGTAIGEFILLEHPHAILNCMACCTLRNRRMWAELFPTIGTRRRANGELDLRRSERKFVDARGRVENGRVHAWGGVRGGDWFSIQQ